MPNDNIKRTIDKALGSGNTDNYESITYEATVRPVSLSSSRR